MNETSWLKDALSYIVGLSKPNFHTDDAKRVFTDRDLKPVRAPIIDPATVNTLSGFCDLADNAFEGLNPGAVIAQVVSPALVTLYARASDDWARRTVFVRSQLPEVEGFRFGHWHEHEAFIIALQSLFVATDDRDYLLQVASNLTSQAARVSDDDGVSQTVNLRAGVVLKANDMVVKSRVKLAPFRTFREIEQPASEFVFRLRGGGENATPMLALFEADGGKWKLDAMENIGRFLRIRFGDQTPVEVII